MAFSVPPLDPFSAPLLESAVKHITLGLGVLTVLSIYLMTDSIYCLQTFNCWYASWILMIYGCYYISPETEAAPEEVKLLKVYEPSPLK